MYVYIYIYIYIYVHVCVCACVCVCIYIYICVCVCVCVYMRVGGQSVGSGRFALWVALWGLVGAVRVGWGLGAPGCYMSLDRYHYISLK